jgi:steroid delta-isomerase
MHRVQLSAFVGGAALLLGLASPAAADDAAGRAALESASRALDAALQKDDAEGVMAHVAEDVVMMPPGEAPVLGKAAMRAWYEGFLAGYETVSLAFSEREVMMDGDLAVLQGRHEWTLAPRPGGDPFTDVGSYLQVWRRQPDGRWLFAREIWNSAAPPPAP